VGRRRFRIPIGLAVALGVGVGRLADALWRFRYAEAREDGAHPSGHLQTAVYALWHQNLLPLAILHARRGAAVLTSQNRDGEIIARLLTRWGFLPIRGSSTRGGSAGLRAMIRAASEGHPIAFTPDGPRGPARKCKPGVIKAAAESGLPIIPVGAWATPARRLDSWDGFVVPGPLATIFVSYGEPISVPATAEADLDHWTAAVEQAIDGEMAKCQARAGTRAAKTGDGLPGGAK
jgi:lysophospholipid acyltransferase (LPLAT)-like uncharacterized protein